MKFCTFCIVLVALLLLEPICGFNWIKARVKDKGNGLLASNSNGEGEPLPRGRSDTRVYDAPDMRLGQSHRKLLGAAVISCLKSCTATKRTQIQPCTKIQNKRQRQMCTWGVEIRHFNCFDTCRNVNDCTPKCNRSKKGCFRKCNKKKKTKYAKLRCKKFKCHVKKKATVNACYKDCIVTKAATSPPITSPPITPPPIDSIVCPGDDNLCTQDLYNPVTGDCVYIPVTCGPGDQCNDNVCDPSVGCQFKPKTDLTACDDGLACTAGDVCTSGVCSGTSLCSGTSQCDDGVCNPTTGACDLVLKDDATPCEGSPCTTNGRCESGVCVGDPVTCGSNECNDGVCLPATGVCTLFPKLDTTPCEDDGNLCTNNYCEAGSCLAVPITCPAGQSCDSATGTCTDVDCSDGNKCTYDVYDFDAGECKNYNIDCSVIDQECRMGLCDFSTGTCTLANKPDTTPCTDNDLCTESDQCNGLGSCVGVAKDCSVFDNACNTFSCDALSGNCVPSPVTIGTACDSDSNPCTVDDFCNAAGLCVPGTLNGCSSENAANTDPCTEYTCDPASGGLCIETPVANGTLCDDGLACTTGDICTGGVCGGTATDCSGFNPGDQCNTYNCDSVSGECLPTAVMDGTSCSDGNPCSSATGLEASPDQCESGVCKGTSVICDDDQCNIGLCNPVSGGFCVSIPKDDMTPCEDDGDLCTNNYCEAGSCLAVPITCPLGESCDSLTGLCTEINCSDGNKCTYDVYDVDALECKNYDIDCSVIDQECSVGVCNGSTGTCVLIPRSDTTTCDDKDACTESDQCNGEGSCVGVAKDCSGFNPTDQCNSYTCQAGTGACVPSPVATGTPCNSDSNLCTVDDICVSGLCIPGAFNGCSSENAANNNTCVEYTCQPGTGACVSSPVTNGTACDSDSNLCTVNDSCNAAGLCVPGVLNDCSLENAANTNPCIEYTCQPGTGACAPTLIADGTDCDDSRLCTTGDKCTSGVCSGTPKICEDGPCTFGLCNPGTGLCFTVSKPNSTSCDDLNGCTTDDHCTNGICAGTPKVCGPGDQCNDDLCNPENGTCGFTPKANGTTCEDLSACTSATGLENSPDQCLGGVCSGVPVSCGPVDPVDFFDPVDAQCNDNVCNPDSGICELTPKTEPTQCEDGDKCTSETGAEDSPDHCVNGTCVGTSVVCEDKCNVGICVPEEGTCVRFPKSCPAGQTCNNSTGCEPVDP